ncbi:hypothetical protein FM107_05570 [Sphingobacterium sp. JB170]|nr:hypothetical protein FM107_05570 [Sphingobacterium sp. JB170]
MAAIAFAPGVVIITLERNTDEDLAMIEVYQGSNVVTAIIASPGDTITKGSYTIIYHIKKQSWNHITLA